jgi:hydroxymethylpyrimidine/phosphomethylpyrimidine kinase
MRVYGASVVTSVFAQNTKMSHDAYALPANVVNTQLGAVLDDLPVRAVKTGAFASPEACAAVAAKARAGLLPNLVVDPVRGSSDWQIGAGRGPIDHFGWSSLSLG